VTREETFEHLEDWLDVVLATVGDIPRVLVGNKVDLEELRVVPRSYAELYARKKGFLAYYEVSAKSGANVDAPFSKLVELLIGSDHGG
jgi:GTPase SAR1 family protein